MPNSGMPAPNQLTFITKVGRCGYGEVWKGKWNKRAKNTYVYIKKLSVIGHTERQRKTIIDEVNTLTRLQNPNILQIYGACSKGLEVWVVTEYIEGKSLFDVLHSNEHISLEVRLRLALQAVKGVHALHSSSPTVLHRDIKSANFLVSNDYAIVKLCDFALSKIVTVVSDVSRAIEAPRWGAPETLEYPPHWSTAADIYSLGMTFYEIATLQIPFYDVSDSELKDLVQSPMRPSLPEDLPVEFARIICMCWGPEVQTRPTSEEVLQFLEPICNKYETEIPVQYKSVDKITTDSKRKSKKSHKKENRQGKTKNHTIKRFMCYA